MRRKKSRSERFYERKNNSGENYRENIKRTKRKLNRKRHRRKKNPLIYILTIFLLCIIAFFVNAKNPKQTVEYAMKQIKNANIEKQKEVFDKMGYVSETMGDYYTDDEKIKQEFLKACFSNLDYEILSEDKREDGVYVKIKVDNINYMQVFENTDLVNDFDQVYFENLRHADDKKSKEVEILLKKKFHGYYILESEDFIDATIGGALD
ncbi:MAG: hypothetical protein Q4B52_00425 [Tissierellia bacterium]|nr:hypothetical protein [Tissierellia bacterium]